jgi:hypothetical protein
MQEAWLRAADELGIRITVPYVISSGRGPAVYVAFIPDFGGPRGMVVWPVAGKDDRLVAAREAALYFSQLSASYSAFDRQLFIDTLTDWGWFGPDDDKPGWYTGEAWS